MGMKNPYLQRVPLVAGFVIPTPFPYSLISGIVSVYYPENKGFL